MRIIDLKAVNLLTEMYLKIDKLQDEDINSEFEGLRMDKEIYDDICRINGLILETLTKLYER